MPPARFQPSLAGQDAVLPTLLGMGDGNRTAALGTQACPPAHTVHANGLCLTACVVRSDEGHTDGGRQTKELKRAGGGGGG